MSEDPTSGSDGAPTPADETRAEEIQRRLKEGDVVVLHRLSDRFEHQEIEQVLQAEDIPYEVRLSYETAFSYLFTPQRGVGVVLCRADDADRARSLIGAFQATEPSVEEAFPGGDPEDELES